MINISTRFKYKGIGYIKLNLLIEKCDDSGHGPVHYQVWIKQQGNYRNIVAPSAYSRQYMGMLKNKWQLMSICELLGLARLKDSLNFFSCSDTLVACIHIGCPS